MTDAHRGFRMGIGPHMVQLAILVLAQGGQNTQEAPDGGVGAALIVGVLVAIVLAMTILYLVVSRRSRASRGGVQPPPDSRRPGPPPLESIDRDR